MSVFGAVDDEPTDESWQALADLVGPDGDRVVFRAEVTEPPGWTTIARLEGLQMLGDAAAGCGEPFDPRPTGWSSSVADDVPEMLELIARTEPGPFEVRTIDDGHVLRHPPRRSARRHGRATPAMRRAGSRSARCAPTPTNGARAWPAGSSAAVVAAIRDEGAEPFLQVATGNDPALRLYESMGFETVRPVAALVLQPPSP